MCFHSHGLSASSVKESVSVSSICFCGEIRQNVDLDIFIWSAGPNTCSSVIVA